MNVGLNAFLLKSEFLRDWGSRDPRVLKFSPIFYVEPFDDRNDIPEYFFLKSNILGIRGS